MEAASTAAASKAAARAAAARAAACRSSSARFPNPTALAARGLWAGGGARRVRQSRVCVGGKGCITSKKGGSGAALLISDDSTLLPPHRSFPPPLLALGITALDIEGAETVALQSFPFEEHLVRVVTVERPRRRARDALARNGFRWAIRDAWGGVCALLGQPTAGGSCLLLSPGAA